MMEFFALEQFSSSPSITITTTITEIFSPTTLASSSSASAHLHNPPTNQTNQTTPQKWLLS
jgi:hypothetical protein